MSRIVLSRLVFVGLTLMAGAVLWWRSSPPSAEARAPAIPAARKPGPVVSHLPTPSTTNDQAVLASLRATAQTDPDRALAQANQLMANSTQAEIYSSFFAEFAARDLSSAIARLAQVPAGAGRDNALRAIADVWTRSDGPGALAWAQSLPPADRAAALESVINELARTEPLRAIELATKFLGGLAFERIAFNALQQLTPSDPRSAAAIVSQLPMGETQTLAASAVARTLAEHDPTEALTWINTLPGATLQRLALNCALEGWATKDAVAPGAYVALMPAGAAQDAAAEHVARMACARSPQAAIEWAQALASESARRVTLTAIGSVWAQREPVAATHWAATLPAGAAQTGAVSGAYSYWLLRDATAARAWLATANLAEDVKVRIVRQ